MAVKPAAAPARPRKRAPQHDSAYYAKLGQRGGASLKKQRGPGYYAEIAKLSHPRAVYNGGRPKGSTKAKKAAEEAAAAKKLAKKGKQKK